MGPCAFIESPRQPVFKFLLNHYKMLKKTTELMRIYKITFDNRIGIKIGQMACLRAKGSASLPCKLLMSLMDSNQINCVMNLFTRSFLLGNIVMPFFVILTILDQFTKHFYQYTGRILSSTTSSLCPIDSFRLDSLYSHIIYIIKLHFLSNISDFR